MQRAKLLAVCAGALLVLAISAIPASAWFDARTSGATQGNFHSGGAGVLTSPTGGVILCSKASGAWHIESSGKISGQQKTEQFLTKQGPHLGLTISKWEGCQSSTGIPVTVSPCLLQFEQPVKGVNSGTGSVGTACVLKIPATGCEFEVGNAGNEFLKAASYTAVGLNVEAKGLIEGITITVSAAKKTECELAGITANKENKFKGILIAEGVELT
jgi:hypothetical protein